MLLLLPISMKLYIQSSEGCITIYVAQLSCTEPYVYGSIYIQHQHCTHRSTRHSYSISVINIIRRYHWSWPQPCPIVIDDIICIIIMIIVITLTLTSLLSTIYILYIIFYAFRFHKNVFIKITSDSIILCPFYSVSCNCFRKCSILSFNFNAINWKIRKNNSKGSIPFRYLFHPFHSKKVNINFVIDV